METDHIVPREQDGTDAIDNAIPVCFECHAEIHAYNDKHPRGRKFTPTELREHKAQWLRICAENPGALLTATQARDVGPLQALIDELEFNRAIASRVQPDERGAMFYDEQFRRAIAAGAVAILRDEIRSAVLGAYAAIASANGLTQAVWAQRTGTDQWAQATNKAGEQIVAAGPAIDTALGELLTFLRAEPASSETDS
jgi:hypothetical protein